MKKYIIVILLLIVIACKEEKKSCCKKESTTNETSEQISDISLHDITCDWTTQDNKVVQLENFKQKVIVMAMIFTNCQSACPRITADLKRIEKEIKKDELNNVHFVLISMDPVRDTPAQLNLFAKEHQLDLNRWTLLHGNETDVLDIAGVLNVRVDKLEDGGFDHSNIIHIVNNKGNIIHQQIGLAIEPKESLQFINQLLDEN